MVYLTIYEKDSQYCVELFIDIGIFQDIARKNYCSKQENKRLDTTFVFQNVEQAEDFCDECKKEYRDVKIVNTVKVYRVVACVPEKVIFDRVTYYDFDVYNYVKRLRNCKVYITHAPKHAIEEVNNLQEQVILTVGDEPVTNFELPQYEEIDDYGNG